MQSKIIQYRHRLPEIFKARYSNNNDEWTDDISMRALPYLVQGKLQLGRNISLLDIGCGKGNDIAVYSSFYDKTTGIDIVSHDAWVKIEPKNIFFICDYFQEHIFDEKYDLIIDNGCMHHQTLEEMGEYLDKIKAILKKSGNLVISSFYSKEGGSIMDDERRLHHYFTDKYLSGLLNEHGFTNSEDIFLYRPKYDNYYRILFCKAI